jgi:bromodomain and WD repeat domain-containing protein 1/3
MLCNFSGTGLPRMKGGSVPVTDHELRALMFKPKPTDWPTEGRDEVCDRISQALDKVMELSIAEHFLAPVDLNAFPVYGMIIAYPIDLSLIKERLEKRFYR